MDYTPDRSFEILINYNISELHQNLSDVLIEQIKHEILYLKKYHFDKYITLLETIKRKYKKLDRKILFMNVIKNFLLFSSFPYNMTKLDAHHLNNLYVVNNFLHKIYFKYPLSINGYRCVYLGKDNDNTQYVIKLITDKTKSIKYEMNILDLLKKNDTKLCIFNNKYTFWDNPVLCMEKLKKLDKTDNVMNVGKQILKILKNIHKFGVHCDIKPDNIMKKNNNDYYLIDFGGFAIEKLHHGYHRKCWSTNWASQERTHNQVTTYKNDLLELIFTLNVLNMIKKKYRYTYDDIKIISPKNKKLYKYYKTVKEINDQTYDYDKIKYIYDKLIKILS